MTTACRLILIVEPQDSGQHGGGARDLLLLVHRRGVGSVGLEVVRNALRDESQDGQQIVLLAVLVELGAQRLHEPRTARCVAPRVKS